jgi:hypothetical protein
MPGYSGTPLPKKLGIKEDHRVLLVDAPDGFVGTLVELPPGVLLCTDRDAGPFDVIICFVRSEAEFKKRLAKLKRSLVQNGGLWIAWPKRASKVQTDMTEDVVRKHALPVGLVDNKVCAVDEVWSGLRLVIPVKERKEKPGVSGSRLRAHRE